MQFDTGWPWFLDYMQSSQMNEPGKLITSSDAKSKKDDWSGS